MTSWKKKIGDIEMDTKYTNNEALQKLMSELDIGLNCEEIYSEEDAIKILEIDNKSDE